MPGPIEQYLSEDHARLHALRVAAVADPDHLDLDAYEAFRAGLLRHIAIEEKVLFVDARDRTGQRLPITTRLHADHAALASLLVPSPTHALLTTMGEILAEHDPLEEGPDGLYAVCERLAGDDLDDVVARMHAVPAVRLSPHADGPRVQDHIARMLAARR